MTAYTSSPIAPRSINRSQERHHKQQAQQQQMPGTRLYTQASFIRDRLERLRDDYRREQEEKDQ